MEGSSLEARRYDRDTHLKAIAFPALRDDWYRGVDLMVRLVARASAGEPIVFESFPRQWLPLFTLWGVNWLGSVAPPEPVPIASDLDEAAVLALISASAARGQLRILVEAWAALDPLLADVLYRLDRRPSPPPISGEACLPLTGWQSYGRPEVQAFDRLVAETVVARPGGTAVLLPCARGRPYGRSRTHRRIWRALLEQGVIRDDVHAVVISSIGVVPEEHWDHPIALAYDSGVPDIWRVLRLMRQYFKLARYAQALDCLDFAPYSEAVAIIAHEGLLGKVSRIAIARPRKLPSP